MTYFDDIINFRLRGEFWDKIVEICHKFPEKFDSPSHFCRVAIIRLLKEYRDLDQKDLEDKKNE